MSMLHLRAAGTASAVVVACAGRAWAQECLTWGTMPGEPGVRSYPAMCFDERRGVAVLFGGTSNADTWEWDGLRWAMIPLPAWPYGRDHPSLTFDPLRGVAVMFGGHFGPQSAVTNETWEYDGLAWRQRMGPLPPARTFHAAAYDRVRGELVLFGGGVPNTTRYADTWVWNGSVWAERMAPGPAARWQHAMEFDRARGVVVLHGGYLEQGGETTQTWEWDGAAWTLRSGAGPNTGEMYFDARLGRVRLLAAASFTRPERLSVWDWNGADWTPVPALGPEWRRHAATAYDTARESVLLYGGYNVMGGPQRGGFVEARTSLAFAALPGSRVVAEGETLHLSVRTCGEGVEHQWRRNGQPLRDDGRITGSGTADLMVRDFGPGDEGAYDAVATGPAGSIVTPPAAIGLWMPGLCYPDCDTSTGRGTLDIFDFLCFLSAYDIQANYACDCDTAGPGVCDIFDFLCFANAFARGCP